MRFYFHVLSLSLALTAIASAASSREAKRNPQIAGVVKEISAQKIEASIRKLVSFGTRHTLSDTKSDTHGIGAARRWMQAEFERYAKDSGGRLQVTMDEFTQPPGETKSATGARSSTSSPRCRASSRKRATGSMS